MIAPTPEAKGKIERAMRTFQHRIVVTLKAAGVDNEVRAQRLIAEGRNRLRPDPTNPVVPRILPAHRF